MLTPRAVETLALARSSTLSPWSPADLFPGQLVPRWAVDAIRSLIDMGLVAEVRAGACKWKYELTGADMPVESLPDESVTREQNA